MARDTTDSTPIETRNDLVDWFEAGCKPGQAIGIENEKIPFYRDTLRPVPYEGEPAGGRGGIRALLDGLAARQGWDMIVEEGCPIGLSDDAGTGGAVSLEPGGQFELSGAPLRTLHESRDELADHLSALKAVAEPLGIGFLALGSGPKWRLDETPMMPKGRYRIMAGYMPKVGTRGLDMMFRTSTVQANLDFASEADMVRKLRVSLALQPIATALFANSPFKEGRPSGFLSERSHIWRDTDVARSGMMPFAFEAGMGFERYVDYALDVPMYFVKRGDRYHDVSGASFRDLLEGRLPGLPGERATLSDWANHLSTIFPEVRLKRYLEMRGEDVGPADMIVALGALFAGLLYDGTALDAAEDLAAAWSGADQAGLRQAMRDAVPTQGFRATAGGRSFRDIAGDMLAIARGGLARRGFQDANGSDETQYLAPLDELVDRGQTRADMLLERFHGAWGGSVDPAFTECVY